MDHAAVARDDAAAIAASGVCLMVSIAPPVGFANFASGQTPTVGSHAWHSLTKCFRRFVCGAGPSTYSANCSTVRVESTHSHTQKTSRSFVAGAKTGLWYPAAWFAIANSFQSADVNADAAFQNSTRSSSLLKR